METATSAARPPQMPVAITPDQVGEVTATLGKAWRQLITALQPSFAIAMANLRALPALAMIVSPEPPRSMAHLANPDPAPHAAGYHRSRRR